MPVLLRGIIFSVVVPGAIAGLWPWWVVNHPTELPFGDVRWPRAWWLQLGWIPTLAGAAGYLRCAWDFARRGGGTPAPWDAPRRFVAAGLYRSVRNPMYVSVGLMLLGQVLLYGAPVILNLLFLLWAGFHLFVVLYEEPHLRRIFGAEYADYTRRVRRWLPRWPVA